MKYTQIWDKKSYANLSYTVSRHKVFNGITAFQTRCILLNWLHLFNQGRKKKKEQQQKSPKRTVLLRNSSYGDTQHLCECLP